MSKDTGTSRAQRARVPLPPSETAMSENTGTSRAQRARAASPPSETTP